MKRIATKEQLQDCLLEGMTKKEMVEYLGYASVHSLNWALRHFKLDPARATIETLAKAKQQKMERDIAKCFVKPIAAQDFRTRKGYNRIEEIWAGEGLA